MRSLLSTNVDTVETVVEAARDVDYAFRTFLLDPQVCTLRTEDARELFANVESAYNVLDAAGRAGADIVWASSESAYGFPFADSVLESECVPIDENHPLLPEYSYGVSKSRAKPSRRRLREGTASRSSPCDRRGSSTPAST